MDNQFNSHSGTWIRVSKYLRDERKDLVDELINRSPEHSLLDHELRGKIKFIDELLGIPPALLEDAE